MAVNDVFKLAFVHNVPNGSGNPVTTLHYRQTGQVTALTGVFLVQDVINAWIAEAQTAYRNCFGTNVTLETIEGRNITDPLFGVDDAIGVAGTRPLGVESSMGPRDAPVVSLRTGLIGRSYRGRAYLMPVPEVDQTNGVMIAAMQTAIDDYFAAANIVTGPVSGNTYTMTIFSKKLTGEGPIVDNLVTSWIVRAAMGSQRRRRKVGA